MQDVDVAGCSLVLVSLYTEAAGLSWSHCPMSKLATVIPRQTQDYLALDAVICASYEIICFVRPSPALVCKACVPPETSIRCARVSTFDRQRSNRVKSIQQSRCRATRPASACTNVFAVLSLPQFAPQVPRVNKFTHTLVFPGAVQPPAPPC